MTINNAVDVLLVEDNPGDIMLITEAIAETGTLLELHCVRDGIEAMQFLKKEHPFENSIRPSLVILDLNLPRKGGQAVLAEVKSDPNLSLIPVIILSGSDAPQDIANCYTLHANCYIVKPRDLIQLHETISSIIDFWLKKVTLPQDNSTLKTLDFGVTR